MKFHQSRSTLFAITGALLLTSCGPVRELFNVEVKIPAKYPIEFAGNSVALFSNIGKGNDSLLMVNLASGISSSMEERLSYQKGAIPVFNLVEDSSVVRDIYYIQSLSQKSNADILMVIDSLKLGSSQHIKKTYNPDNGDAAYDINYVCVPFTSVINVYDGITANNIATIRQTDSVYWELLTKSDFNMTSFLPKLYDSLNDISKGLGKSVSDNFFDNWETVDRYLYIYNNGYWTNAFYMAKDFKWKEASDVWLRDVASSDKVKAACAAFNLAVSCEMTDRKDLAVKWIEYSKENFKLPGIDNYESLLKK